MSNQPPEPLFYLRGHGAPVNVAQFSRFSENHLLSGAADGSLILWDLKKKQAKSHHRAAHSSQLIPGGILHIEQLLDLADLQFDKSQDNIDIDIDDSQNNKNQNTDDETPKQTPNYQKPQISNCPKILTQGRDQFVRLWDLERSIDEKKPLCEISVPLSTFCKIGLLDSHTFISAIQDPTTSLDIFSINSGKKEWSWKMEKIAEKKRGMMMDLKTYDGKFCGFPSDRIVAVSFEDGSIEFWSAKGGKKIFEIPLHNHIPTLCFDFNSNLSIGVAGTSEKNLTQFQISMKQQRFSRIKEFVFNNDGIQTIKIRSDQRIFASAGWDHRIRIFDFKKSKALAILKGHSESVYSLDFSPFSKSLLCSASKDKRVAIWSIY